MLPTRRKSIIVLGATAFLIALGCTPTEPPPPAAVATTVTVTPVTATLAAIGATEQLTAQVKDQNGAVMANQSITWSSGTASVATVSNGGLVTAASNGSSTITATVGTASGTAAITVAQAVTNSAINAGDGQTANAGTAVTVPPSAVVKDANGNVVAGATVTWVVSQGGGSVTGASSTSNASGIATVGSWTLGATAGTNTLLAQSGTAVSLGFTATGTVGAAAIVNVAAGDAQQATAGTAVTVAPAVLVTDASGNPVAGETVSFTVTAGGGVAAVSGASSATDIVTDGTGHASLTSWTLGTAAGAQTLEAAVGALTPTVFTATATADVPASITAFAGDGQSAPAGTPVPIQPIALVVDQYGNPVDDVTVTFAVGLGGGSITGATQNTDVAGHATLTSWTLGAEGPNTVMASVGAVTPATFQATGTPVGAPATLTVVSGDGQDVLAGSEVVMPLSVLVKDFANQPVPGATVDFAVTGGGGAITGGAAITNSTGVATSGIWTYGGTPGSNEVTATIAAVTPAVFTGEGVAAGGYNIEIVDVSATPPATEVTTAFANAKARWEALVVGELGDIDFTSSPITAGVCAINPSFADNIDDLLIWVRIEAIDGVGGVLGSAGPCHTRNSTGLSVTGIMRFDEADLANLVSNGTLEDVILHEMGHVIGIGTLWGDGAFDLLRDPSDAGPPAVINDTYYIGAFGLVAFDRLGGATYTGGQIVPVENSGGAGTVNGHWRETTFNNELMTGFIAGTGNPLSLLTIASLADMGMVINPGGADAYTQVFTSQSAVSAAAIEMKDDIWIGPLYRVGTDGRQVRVR